MTMEILAYHGWGFTASCWQHYTHALSPATWKSFDRGYFGNPQDIGFSTASLESGRVVIAHSYGLHFCPLSVLAKTELLILLNSFLRFHSSETRLQQKSQRKLGRMIQAFAQDPLQTWANFMTQTFLPDSVPLPYTLGQDLEFSSDRLARSLLGADLEALNRLTPPPEWMDCLAQIPQILLVTSPADRIVTAPLRATQFSQGGVAEILLSSGGHGAPFVQTDYCVTKISEAIGSYVSQKPYNARD
ncbi:MAG: alpha/beta fold hydrolase [Prochlorotrichaceae cyanobacterium]